ncbi:Rb -related protein [Dorcoceras hygrometricum]|uniref:Rb-related protein n=1 Tax=Dorcoceras hygrometricum TaxID=472368 RepID=A0A2Z7D6M2_9LAMI|nr:Rb -related protein [Dorcoceras hygrometricum]
MQGIKATTESREPKDLNNSSTARSDQKNNQFVATGILSTWELPTHLQYTIPDANNQLHLLLLTHEMWELPTPLLAANKPSRENEVRELPARLQAVNKLTSVAMQGIKATTESREPKDLNNSLTARSDQKNNQFVATGILSTWELPTHLQYTIPDANNQLHLLLLTHEMWELPTPLLVANKPSRENELICFANPKTLSFQLIQTTTYKHPLLKHASALATAQRLLIPLRMLNTITTANVTTAELQHSAMTCANY